MSRKDFDPVDYNLATEFRLTKLSDLKGWGCKVPRDVLHRLLEGFQSAETNGNGDGQHSANHSVITPEPKSTPVIGMLIKYLLVLCLEIIFIGIGLDSCVLPLRHGEFFLVQSTDFFYPLVDDPYVMVNISLKKTFLSNLLDYFREE